MEEKSAVTEANTQTNTNNTQVNDRAPNAKERSILDRLSTIRVGKSKILSTLGMLKEKTDNGENIGKELIEKLLQAYDSLNAQEEEFISTLKRLAGLDEQLSAQNTTISSSEAVETKTEKEAGDCEDMTWEEADKTFGEAEKMAENATTAAHLHDQLKIYIALQEKKKAALDELHRKYMSQKVDESQKALQEVEMSKLKLASESTSLDRKQKQLERLRREAAKRGYIRQGAIPPVEKETSQASNTKKAINPAEHLLEDERVPSIPVLPPTSPETAEVVTEPSQKQHANKDELHNKISERFASFESRKQRMRLLRSKLNQIEESKMDQTYSDALSRLEHLTSVRKQLENMQVEEGETTARNDSAKINQDNGSTHSSSNEADKSTAFGPHSKKSSQDSVDNVSVATDEVNVPQYDEHCLPYDDKPMSLDSQFENQYAEPTKAAELEEEIRRASEFLRSQSNDRGTQPLPGENVSQQIDVQSRRATMSAFNGMEQEICAVLEATASWLKLHENEPTEETTINSLRDIMLEKSKEVLPSDVRLASKDFNAQLTTAIDDCLAKYLGTNLALLKDSLIADLSEILYNEFACLKLMYNADHIAEENK